MEEVFRRLEEGADPETLDEQYGDLFSPERPWNPACLRGRAPPAPQPPRPPPAPAQTPKTRFPAHESEPLPRNIPAGPERFRLPAPIACGGLPDFSAACYGRGCSTERPCPHQCDHPPTWRSRRRPVLRRSCDGRPPPMSAHFREQELADRRRQQAQNHPPPISNPALCQRIMEHHQLRRFSAVSRPTSWPFRSTGMFATPVSGSRPAPPQTRHPCACTGQFGTANCSTVAARPCSARPGRVRASDARAPGGRAARGSPAASRPTARALRHRTVSPPPSVLEPRQHRVATRSRADRFVSTASDSACAPEDKSDEQQHGLPR
jgi:hypothetical protein